MGDGHGFIYSSKGTDTNGGQNNRNGKDQWEFNGYVRASLANINDSVKYIRESVDELRAEISSVKTKVAGWSALFGSISAILMVGITKLLGG